MEDETWIESGADEEIANDSRARGGWLSPAGRRAAIGSALSVVGRYFQSQGEISSLASYSGLALVEDESDLDQRLLSALRFRQSITIAHDLIAILERILRRPTFRYSLTQSQRIGEITGALDMGRYAAMNQPIHGGPPVYPILEVHRSRETPENVLAAYGALWIVRELEVTERGSAAPSTSPEAAQATFLIDRLRTLLGQPAFQDAHSAAAETLRRATEALLFDRVAERLRRREVATPEPYKALLDLLTQLHAKGPSGVAGAEIWSFYDESFDRRLFELWCLYQIGQAISRALVVEPPAYEADRSGLAFKWERPAGMIEVYAQRAIHTVYPSQQPRWRRKNDKALGGIPDYVVKVTHRDTGSVRLALLDAKLRQRSEAPIEELYKVLGYFDNFGLNKDQRGGILHYSPVSTKEIIYDYYDKERDGRLLATALNPVNENQVHRGLEPVAEMILSLLGIPVAIADDMATGLFSEENVVQHRLAELNSVTVQLAPPTLDASMRRVMALIGQDGWSRLSPESQAMLGTAEHVGFLLGEDADYSGPVLGLVAPMEVILDECIAHVARQASPHERSLERLTLGRLLDFVLGAIDNRSYQAAQLLRQAILSGGIDPRALEPIILTLKNLNSTYRNRAAHKETLSRADWMAVYHKVLVGDQLLRRLIYVLHPAIEVKNDTNTMD